MNLIISGYGKMGHEIEQAAKKKHHRIAAVFDSPEDWLNLPEYVDLNPIVIDFSEPQAVVGNIEKCFEMHVPVVVGTTGWDNRREQIRSKCLAEGQALLAASNFSIGMNLMFAMNRYFSQLINRFPDYDVSIEEIHHIHKKDKPSGTAITLADQLINNLDRKSTWDAEQDQQPETLNIRSIRENEVPGIHKIIFDSDVDTIQLIHSAKNRKGFARGAILAAEWLQGKTGFFGMEDVVK